MPNEIVNFSIDRVLFFTLVRGGEIERQGTASRNSAGRKSDIEPTKFSGNWEGDRQTPKIIQGDLRTENHFPP